MKQDRKSSAGPTAKGFAKTLLIAGGSLSVGLAVVGIFIPVLPTTPFLLLATFCFARSSRRCYDWLMHNRWFGPYLRNYREGRGIPLQQKILAITLLWMTIGYAVCFVVTPLWGRIFLLSIATAVTWHLVTVRTYRTEQETGEQAGGKTTVVELASRPEGPLPIGPRNLPHPPRSETNL